LIERALLGLFVRTPAQKLRPMPKAAAGEVVVLHFDDEFGGERLPFGRALGGPAAGTTGRVAGKTRRLDQYLELLCQRRLLV